jgi:hypothetical protein
MEANNNLPDQDRRISFKCCLDFLSDIILPQYLKILDPIVIMRRPDKHYKLNSKTWHQTLK